MKQTLSGTQRLAVLLLVIAFLALAAAGILLWVMRSHPADEPSATATGTQPVTSPADSAEPETDPPVTQPVVSAPTAEQQETLGTLLAQAETYRPATDAPAWKALQGAMETAASARLEADGRLYDGAAQALREAMAAMDARIVTRDGVTYVDGILIVNKTYSVPESYAPGVDSEARAALDVLIAGAAADGVTLKIDNGYRSYALQKNLYEFYVNRDGKAAADSYSARPGFSEHQSGLCFDMNAWDATSPQAQWLAAHCWEYGFVIRYPEGKSGETGYDYEAWHIRYLGETLSRRLLETGQTLEVYLGISSAYAAD